MLKNNEIEILIKMEKLINKFSINLFGIDKKVMHNIVAIDGTSYVVSEDDFIEFKKLIDNCIQAKKERSRKQVERNKKDMEYHRITNNITNAIKSNNEERLEKYRKELEEYNLKKKTEQAKKHLERNGEDK